MRALNLNFAKRPTSLRIVGYVMLLLAIAAAIYIGKIYSDQTADLTLWESKWRTGQRFQHKESSNNKQPIELERLQSELKSANKIIEHLSFPWDRLFQEIDASIDDQVTLLELEPDTEKHEVRITAEAKNHEAMLRYAKRLQDVDFLKNAHITNHQIQQQDAQKPVRFIVNAQWSRSPVNAPQTPPNSITR